MEISAIMNINELAASRRVDSRTDFSAKKNEEVGKLGHGQADQCVAGDRDVLKNEVNNRMHQADAERKREIPVDALVHGGIVNIRT